MFAHLPLRRPGTGTAEAGAQKTLLAGTSFANRPSTVDHNRGNGRAAHCRQAFSSTLPSHVRKSVVSHVRDAARRSSIPLPPAQQQAQGGLHRATSASGAFASAQSFSPQLPGGGGDRERGRTATHQHPPPPHLHHPAHPEPLDEDMLLSTFGSHATSSAAASTTAGAPTPPLHYASDTGTASSARLFNRHPAHQQNMAAEREAWRLERDGHEKKRKKLTAANKELRVETKELGERNKALEEAVTAGAERETALERDNAALRARVEELERALAERQPGKAPPASAGGRPVLRDSDLLRQVRHAESHISQLEAAAAAAAARPAAPSPEHPAAGSPYEPLLTQEFMGMFDIACPLGTGSAAARAAKVNGAAWLDTPPDWHAVGRRQG